MNVFVTFEEKIIISPKHIKENNVTDRQMERKKIKNSISPHKQFSVPISHVLISPSSNENIFSSTGVHIHTIYIPSYNFVDLTFSWKKISHSVKNDKIMNFRE